jgi:ribonuclease T2
VPSNLGRDYLDIVPTMGLIGHQWRKHGSCSGLSQADYLEDAACSARADDHTGGEFALDALPSEIDASKPKMPSSPPIRGMKHDAIAVRCERGYLREIRICMTPSLDYRGVRRS